MSERRASCSWASVSASPSIAICSVAALIYLSQLNTIVRHLAFDPVPGSAAIARIAKDFTQYRALEASSADPRATRQVAHPEGRRDRAGSEGLRRHHHAELRPAAVCRPHRVMVRRRDLAEGDGRSVRPAPSAGAAVTAAQQEIPEKIDALLTTMIEWNRLEGVRSTEIADSKTRVASATVLAMLLAALLLSALAFHFNQTVERPMNALAVTARSVALGNVDVRATVDGPLEVATVARELNAMLDARARADAEARTLSGALEESRAQLQRLAAGLLLAREEERTTIAREIHDELGQTLTALKMDTAWIGRRLADNMPEIRCEAGRDGNLIDEAVVTVRRIATDLRPGILDDLGLAAAVEWQAQEFEHRTGIACVLRGTVDPGAVDPLVSTAVFRIFRSRSPTWRGTAARPVWR